MAKREMSSRRGTRQSSSGSTENAPRSAAGKKAEQNRMSASKRTASSQSNNSSGRSRHGLLGRLLEAISSVGGSMRDASVRTMERLRGAKKSPSQTTTGRPQPQRHSRRVSESFTLSELEATVPSQQNRAPSFASHHGHDYVDQEVAVTMSVEDRWNDEDRLTNRSNDPRIGTHGRTYTGRTSRPSTSASRENPAADVELPER
jgi:hypothetical protein